MLRIPAAELPLASERDRVKMLKQRILDTDKFDRTFLVGPAAARSPLHPAKPTEPCDVNNLPVRSFCCTPRLLASDLPIAAPWLPLLSAAAFSLSVLHLCPPRSEGSPALLQLRTPRSATESAEWGASGRAVTAPAGVVGRPPLPTQVAQLQAEVARLQSQLAMVSSVQAQCALWAHKLMGSWHKRCPTEAAQLQLQSQLALVKIISLVDQAIEMYKQIP